MRGLVKLTLYYGGQLLFYVGEEEHGVHRAFAFDGIGEDSLHDLSEALWTGEMRRGRIGLGCHQLLPLGFGNGDGLFPLSELLRQGG